MDRSNEYHFIKNAHIILETYKLVIQFRKKVLDKKGITFGLVYRPACLHSSTFLAISCSIHKSKLSFLIFQFRTSLKDGLISEGVFTLVTSSKKCAKLLSVAQCEASRIL